MIRAKQVTKPLAYLIVPAVYCGLGYLVLWLALQPLWQPVRSALSLLVSDEATTFDASLTSTYDPKASDAYADASTISGADIVFPQSGEQYGHLSCEDLGLDAPVYWYDSDEILAFGVGQSLASFPPGFGRAIVLAGHNTTFFACLENAAVGDVVTFDTNWCTYEYRVSKVEVFDEGDLGALFAAKGREEREELLMYTCWPFEFIGTRKTDRLLVCAERISGKDVVWRGVSGG